MKNILHQIAEKLVENGKGILAADESTATITKRFDQINLQSTPENRRNYREMLFRTTDAMESYISGVILYDETIVKYVKHGVNYKFGLVLGRDGQTQIDAKPTSFQIKSPRFFWSRQIKSHHEAETRAQIKSRFDLTSFLDVVDLI